MIPAPLLVVTDRHGSPRPLVDTVRAVLDGGARWIWLRDRDLELPARRDLAEALLTVVRAAGGWLTIGGDADLAVAIGADGAHLGAQTIANASRTPPLLGVSAHGIDDLRKAAESRVDYATLSPIFATPSKPGYGPALGLDTLSAAASLGLPLLALGGIGPSEIGRCLESGAAGIAVMGRLMRADDPARETRALLDAIASGR